MRSMTRQATREVFNSSVIYSLAEVARMEQERQEEEALRLAKLREEREHALRLADAERRRAEEIRRAAEDVERRKREREAIETQAVAEARGRAVIEAARIEAESRARHDADAAEREYQLEVLRVRSERGAIRLKRTLVVLLGAMFLGGGTAAYTVVNERAARAAELDRLRGEVGTLSQEAGRAKSDELAALTRRHANLKNRPMIRDVFAVATAAEEARKAIDEKNIDTARLSSFRSALDQLDERLDSVERTAVLDRRYDDLTVWTSEKPGNDFARAQTAATRAKDARGNDAAALVPYERALDRWRDALARSAAATSAKTPAPGSAAARPVARRSSAGSSSPSSSTASSSAGCREGDPLCDLRGRSL